MLTKREMMLGSLIAVFVFLAGYLVGQNVARQPDQTAEVLNLKLENSELQRKFAATPAAQDHTGALQANAEAETAAAQQLQSKLDSADIRATALQNQVDDANHRVQEESETVISLQHQLDQANALAQQEANEALSAEQERDSGQGGNITPAIEQARIHGVEMAMNSACQARLLNIEAEAHLLPKSGPAALVIQIIEAAMKQSAANQAAKQAQQSAPASDDDLGAEAARAAGVQ